MTAWNAACVCVCVSACMYLSLVNSILLRNKCEKEKKSSKAKKLWQHVLGVCTQHIQSMPDAVNKHFLLLLLLYTMLATLQTTYKWNWHSQQYTHSTIIGLLDFFPHTLSPVSEWVWGDVNGKCLLSTMRFILFMPVYRATCWLIAFKSQDDQ